jgi:hypothetical protein
MHVRGGILSAKGGLPLNLVSEFLASSSHTALKVRRLV